VWEAGTNAPERVRIKAAIAAEATLIDITKIIRDLETAPSVKITAHQHISKLGSIDTQPEVHDNDNNGRGNEFRVVIQLPEGKLEVSAPEQGKIVSEQ